MSEKFAIIPIDMLVYSGRNPRTEMRGLEELAENIREYGILEPIIVRPRGDKFEVVVGERRVRASVMAGRVEVPSIVRTITDRQADELRLIENIHRDDLTNFEKGDAIFSLLENYPDRYPTLKVISQALNIKYETIHDWSRASRRLSPFVKSLMVDEEIGAGGRIGVQQSKYLMKYDFATQDKLAKIIAEHNLTGEQTAKFVKLFDANPNSNLDELVAKAKGVIFVEKVVEIPIEEYKTYQRPTPLQTKEVKEKIRKAHKELAHKKREARKRLEERKEVVESKLAISELKEVPRENILERAEAIIERLDEIKHPYQRERMIEVVPKELEELEKRLEKAPERRERVEHKLNRLYELQAEGVFLSTLWGIGERAEYAGSKDFHGNCPPQVVEQCVLRLTKKDDVVLDPMAGSGTAIDVCNLLGKRCIAYDIKPPKERNDIIRNDSRKIPLDDNTVDMIFLHPPYWDMVYYTEDNEEEKLSDLSRASTLEEYLHMLKTVLQECLRVLKPKKYLCILLGDRIKEGKFIPLCRKTANLAEEIGFTDCGYAVKFTRGEESAEVKGQMIYAELAFTENLKIKHDLVMFFKKGENKDAH